MPYIQIAFYVSTKLCHQNLVHYNTQYALFPNKIELVLKKNHELFCPVTSALIRVGVAVQGPLVSAYIPCGTIITTILCSSG